MSVLRFEINLRAIQCCAANCGITFAVPLEWDDAKRRTHGSFTCPNGHSQSYLGESSLEKAERLKREAENRLQSQLNESRHEAEVLRRERDKAIKQKKQIERRIAGGVCPCCNRTFEDLARHMKSKHKEYGLPPGSNPKQLPGAIQ